MSHTHPSPPPIPNLNLRIAYWNANSILDKRLELTDFLFKNNIDILLVNETHLQPGKKFFIPSYRTLRRDRPMRPTGRGRGGGTAVLIKASISHTLCPIASPTIETTSVLIHTTTGPLKLIAAYSPPRAAVTSKDWADLFIDNIPTLLAGDLNAKHTAWNARVSNAKGQTLLKSARTLSLDIIAPSAHTFYPANRRQNSDILDITVSKLLPYLIHLTVDTDLGSDHCIVRVDLSIPSSQTLNDLPPKNQINWKGFHRLLKQKTPAPPTPLTPSEIEEHSTFLSGIISSALHQNSTPLPSKSENFFIPPEILELIRRKRRARKLWRDTGYRPYKTLYNSLTSRIKVLKRAHVDMEWSEKLDSLSTRDNSLWDFLRLINNKKRSHIPPLTDPSSNTVIHSNSGKASIFAKLTAHIHNPDISSIPPPHLRHVNKYVENYFSRAIPPRPTAFTLADLTDTIASSNPKKAPGPDGITTKALQHLPESTIKYIYSIFLASYELGHFPSNWKTAHTIMIPKPGKPHRLPTSYRPISLLNALSKIYETLLLQIMSKHIIHHNLIIPSQAGFTSHTSTIHQAVRLTNQIKEGFHLKKFTASVFLDIERAFDRVWHSGLIYKLIRYDFPPQLVHTIRSYLSNRTFRVKVLNSLSPPEKISAGVPQGSVLSPILFNLFMNDIPTSPNTSIYQYADDTAITAQRFKPSHAVSALNKHIKSLNTWFLKWNLKVNGNKSKAVMFYRNRRPPKNMKRLRIGGSCIPWSRTVKYLGITLDKPLKFNSHITPRLKLTRALKSRLYPLLRYNSEISTHNSLTLYKSVIRPFLIYGHQVWLKCSPTNTKLLNNFQTGILRQILDYPDIPSRFILSDLNIPPISDYIASSTSKFFSTLQFHHNPLYQPLTPLNPPELVRRPNWKSRKKTSTTPTATVNLIRV